MMVSPLCIGLVALVFLAPAFEEKIEARVNEAILTTTELNRTLAPLIRQYEANHRGAELEMMKKQIRETAIQRWIEDQLILQEAKSQERFQVDKMAVERMFEEERSRYGGPEEFERILEREEITGKEYRKLLEDRYKVQALTYQRVTALINISPKRVIEYYRENEARYRELEKARISLIKIPAGATPEQKTAARELAESVLGELGAGADFADLARRHSTGPRAQEGGDFGFIEKGYWMAQLDEAAFGLKVGEHSGIIEVDDGFYILYCAAKKEASLTPLEEVWDGIEEQLFREERQRRYEAWIEDLKSRAHVVVGE